jgi:hypothetical protein
LHFLETTGIIDKKAYRYSFLSIKGENYGTQGNFQVRFKAAAGLFGIPEDLE